MGHKIVCSDLKDGQNNGGLRVGRPFRTLVILSRGGLMRVLVLGGGHENGNPRV